MTRSKAHLKCLLALLCLSFLNSSAFCDGAYTWGLDNSNIPTPVPGMPSGVTQVAAGGANTFAIKDGALFGWGFGPSGGVGDNTLTTRLSPVPLSLSSGVTAVAGGYDHHLAIQNGAVFGWGFNSIGMIGDGTLITRSAPVPVLNLNSSVTAIAAGSDFSLAIQNGSVYAWGSNGLGQLGDGTTTNRMSPVLTTITEGASAIAAGHDHALAIKDGALYAWGSNANGELGTGTFTDEHTPQAIASLGTGVTSIAAGSNYSLAVQNGQVYTWGDNQGSPVGNFNTPTLVPGLSDIIQVAAGHGTRYALASNGKIWRWLANGTPQLLPNSGSLFFTSIDSDAEGTFFIATAVPEPESMSVLTVGAILLLGRYRYRPLIRKG